MKHGNGACTQAKVLYAICMFLLHLHIEDMLPREHRIPDTQIHSASLSSKAQEYK